MMDYTREIKNITGKNIKITNPIKDHIETEYNQLRGKYLKQCDKLNVKVILSVDKTNKTHKCELILNYRHKTYKVSKKTDSMYTAISLCFFTATELIIKQKEKKDQLKKHTNTIRRYDSETNTFYSNLYNFDNDEFEEFEEIQEDREE